MKQNLLPLFSGILLFSLPLFLLFWVDQQVVALSKSKLQESAILQFRGILQSQRHLSQTAAGAARANPALWGVADPPPVFVSSLTAASIIARFSISEPQVYWNEKGWAVVFQQVSAGRYQIFLSPLQWERPPFAAVGVFFVIVLLLVEFLLFWKVRGWWLNSYQRPLSVILQQKINFDSTTLYPYQPISPETVCDGPVREVIEFQNAIFDELEQTQGQTRRIFNTLYEAIFVFGPDKCLIESNYAAAGLLDYGLQELLGMEIEALTFDTNADWLSQWWNNYKFSSQNPIFETKLKTKRGEAVPVLCSVEMLVDAQTQFAGMVFVARDISKQKGQEKKLRILSKVVDQSPVSIALTDRKGIITYVNQAFLQKAMYSENEVLGQHFAGINVSLGKSDVFRKMQATVEAGETWKAELKNQNRGGADYWEQATVTALRDDEGGLQQYIILLEDIHARKQAERQLQLSKMELEDRVELRVMELKKTTHALERAYKELQSLDQMKEEFLTTVSHELKTPLASILGYAEALQDCEMEHEEAVKFYQIIISESVRLTNLINEILDLSTLNADKQNFEWQRLQLADLVEQGIHAVEGLRKNKNVEIAFFAQPIEFVGDPLKLIQVIVNLLSNAVKFTPERSRVNIQADVNQGQLLLSVQDEGPGVPERELQMVFDRFQQFKRKNQAIQGTGLGLAISKKIIEGHQGKIWAESRKEGGFFAFQIPLKRD